MKRRRVTTARAPVEDRATVGLTLGREIARFQGVAEDVDEAAAGVLALDRNDLRCLDRLREGPRTAAALAASLGLAGRAFDELVARLERAGYARSLPGAGDRPGSIDLTPHARTWFESLYGPLREEGLRLLGGYSPPELRLLLRFLRSANDLQARHARRLRALQASGSGQSLKNRPRGGLSPAALRRVYLYVQAHLDGPLPLPDLAARAGLSAYHFARAFKVSTGLTPHAHVQRQRIARAAELIRAGALPLAQVALATGFSSQSRLTTSFRKQMGVTPARYRAG